MRWARSTLVAVCILGSGTAWAEDEKVAAIAFITKVENASARCAAPFNALEQQRGALSDVPGSLAATAEAVEGQCENISVILKNTEPSNSLKKSGDYLADWVTHLSRVAHARSTMAKAVRFFIRDKSFEDPKMSKNDLEVYSDQKSGMLVEAAEATEALQKGRSSLTDRR